MYKILILLLTALATGAALIFTNLPAEPLKETLAPMLVPPSAKIEQPATITPTSTFIPPSQPAASRGEASLAPQEKKRASLAPQEEERAPALAIFAPPPLPEPPQIEIVEKPPEPIPEPLNEEEITQAVVRIRCGKSYGSGFIREINGKKYAFTAAHVVIDKITAKDYSCNVIFPRKNPTHGFYEEAHYRAGKILVPAETETNFKVNGLDFALLEVLPLEDRAEDQRIFPNGYPAVNYPFCPANTLNDKIILWGYTANVSSTGVTFGNVLSRFYGQIINYANASGVEENFLPKLDYVKDISVLHSYTLIISENNFAGASGGLVFDVAKRCVIGNNIATSFDQNMVFGLIANPEYAPLKKFIEEATR